MKRYLIWKNGTFKGTEDKFWTELSGKEFYALVKSPAGKGRYFIHSFDWEDPEAGDWYFEATKESFDKWHVFQQARYRKLMEKLQNPIEFVSLDQVLYYDDNGDPVTLADTIPEELPDAIYGEIDDILERLKPEEKALIYLYYLDNFENKSQLRISEELGIPQQTFSYRLNNTLKKMRSMFGEK